MGGGLSACSHVARHGCLITEYKRPSSSWTTVRLSVPPPHSLTANISLLLLPVALRRHGDDDGLLACCRRRMLSALSPALRLQLWPLGLRFSCRLRRVLQVGLSAHQHRRGAGGLGCQDLEGTVQAWGTGSGSTAWYSQGVGTREDKVNSQTVARCSLKVPLILTSCLGAGAVFAVLDKRTNRQLM